MNWLDDYIAKNETGYYESNDGSCWVSWGEEEEEEVRLAFGKGETEDLTEITREQFIEKLIGKETNI